VLTKRLIRSTILTDVMKVTPMTLKNVIHCKTKPKLSLTYPDAHRLVWGWSVCAGLPGVAWENHQLTPGQPGQ
jgi:hypothetical protein